MDITNIRKRFSIFGRKLDLVYLDSAASGLKLNNVIAKEMEYYEEYSANIHRGNYELSLRASKEYEMVREKVASFLGAGSPEEIVFCGGTTAGINMIAYGLEKNVETRDKIVVTILEHHSNFLPWQRLAKVRGAEFEIWKTNSQGEFSIKEIDWEKVKVLALTQVSNVTGQIVPVQKLISEIRLINPEISIIVDGAQAVAHMKVDVQKIDCDFYVFSGHKLYGPTGVGVIYGKKENLDKLEPAFVGGGMVEAAGDLESEWKKIPEKLEAGTMPIGQVIGLGEAVDFVSELDWQKVTTYETKILKYCLEEMARIDKLRTFGGQVLENRVGVVPFVIDGIHPHDVSEILNRFGVAVRSGHHCAQPLHRALGINATTRASFGIYSLTSDVDKLINGIKEVKKIFGA